MLVSDILECVGNTPLLRADRLKSALNLKGNLYAKLESFNPYSVKDRIALAMVDGAEKSNGFVEATSGNTGIGLAMVCAVRGIRLTVVMPEDASKERVGLLKMLGAEIVFTEAGSMAAARERAERIAKETGSFLCSQFDNPLNPLAHEKTAREILSDMPEKPDIFVAAVGTGGTFSGVARALKAQNPFLRAYAVEPASSPVLSGGKKGAHRIYGIGAGFVPKNFDYDCCNGIETVTDADALDMCGTFAKTEGVAVGVSSGASLCACVKLAKRYPNKNIVTVLPDTFERYLSVFGK